MKPEAGTFFSVKAYRSREDRNMNNSTYRAVSGTRKNTTPECTESKNDVNWGTTGLTDFLTRQCEHRGMSFRSLSMNAGLSAGTVHNIVRSKYRPTIYSLNALADYLGVKREYMWQMAGLLKDMDYSTETTFNDPQVKFHFAQVNKLPEEKRNIILSVIGTLIANLKPEDSAVVVAKVPKGRRKYRTRSYKD